MKVEAPFSGCHKNRDTKWQVTNGLLVGPGKRGPMTKRFGVGERAQAMGQVSATRAVHHGAARRP